MTKTVEQRKEFWERFDKLSNGYAPLVPTETLKFDVGANYIEVKQISKKLEEVEFEITERKIKFREFL